MPRGKPRPQGRPLAVQVSDATLAELLGHQRMSLRAAAPRLGVSPTTVSRMLERVRKRLGDPTWPDSLFAGRVAAAEAARADAKGEPGEQTAGELVHVPGPGLGHMGRVVLPPPAPPGARGVIDIDAITAEAVETLRMLQHRSRAELSPQDGAVAVGASKLLKELGYIEPAPKRAPAAADHSSLLSRVLEITASADVNVEPDRPVLQIVPTRG